MAEFMLALHDDPNAFKDISPEEMQKVVEEYQAWAGELAAQERLAGGHKLTADPGRILKRNGDDTIVRDGPFSETKEILGGYFLIVAEDYADAERLCQSCPHLKFGGTIELRAVDGGG